MTEHSPHAEAQSVHDTLMWEARAVPGLRAELLAWVHGQPVPVGCSAEVFTAADDRVVVILRSPGAVLPPRLPDPPTELLARPVHQWPFAFQGRLGAEGH